MYNGCAMSSGEKTKQDHFSSVSILMLPTSRWELLILSLISLLLISFLFNSCTHSRSHNDSKPLFHIIHLGGIANKQHYRVYK